MLCPGNQGQGDIQDGRNSHRVGEEQRSIHRMERREQSQGWHGAEGGEESQDDEGGFSGTVLPRCLSVKGGSELGLSREALVLCENERSEHTEC